MRLSRQDSEDWAPRDIGPLGYAAVAALLVAALLVALGLIGRPLAPHWRLIGPAAGPEGSTALLDGYSLLHLAAGLLLRAALAPRTAHWPRGWLICVAIASSVIWEIVENLPAVAALYGDADAAYAGDSMVNALGDTLAVVAGFALAGRLPLAATLSLTGLVEIGLTAAGLQGLASNIASLTGL